MSESWGRLPSGGPISLDDIEPGKHSRKDKKPQKRPPWTEIRTYQELVHYCLRKLGAPLVNIELADEQILDCISDALLVYLYEHLDSVENFYWAARISDKACQKGYVQLPPDVIDIIDVFSTRDRTGHVYSAYNSELLNNYEYLFKSSIMSGSIGLGASDIYDLVAYYDILTTSWNLVKSLFDARVQFNWIPRERRLYLYREMRPGNILVFYGAKMLNPEKDTSIWNSPFMRQYLTALLGLQWAVNISKFQNVQTAGGLTLRAEELYARYSAEAEKLKAEWKASGSEPPLIFWG